MKHILVVGVHSTIGQGLTEAYAKDCDKIALVSWSTHADGEGRTSKCVKKALKEAEVTVSCFKGDLSSKKEWEFVSYCFMIEN